MDDFDIDKANEEREKVYDIALDNSGKKNRKAIFSRIVAERAKNMLGEISNTKCESTKRRWTTRRRQAREGDKNK